MKDEVLLTREGRERLLEELRELKGPVRRRVGEMLREVRAHGDIRENAAYEQAKLVQSRLEGRIKDLEWILAHAKIVERPDGVAEGIVHLGSHVALRHVSTGHRIEVTLVGAFEADPEAGKVSLVSPMGRALVGRSAGEKVVVNTPRGVTEYEIVAVTEPGEFESLLE